MLYTGCPWRKGQYSGKVIVSAVSKQKGVCVLFRTVSEIELVHCTDEQHAMSSHELQSALMLMVEFWIMYYTT
jgi:hypothetical protein